MKEHTPHGSIDAPYPATEPHFEDEWTLQSARPVVPLEKINAKERHRRHWLLGGAFAIAMMLGAASALLTSYLKLRNVPVVASEITEIETSAAAVAEEPVQTDLPVTEQTDEVSASLVEEPVTSDVPKPAPVVRRRATIPRDTELVRPRTVRGMGDQDEELQRIRDAVLVDQWEERRARRAARRDRRNRVDHHDRDLSNLDEIFEGQRRRRP